jgi:hypothetical protein
MEPLGARNAYKGATLIAIGTTGAETVTIAKPERDESALLEALIVTGFGVGRDIGAK